MTRLSPVALPRLTKPFVFIIAIGLLHACGGTPSEPIAPVDVVTPQDEGPPKPDVLEDTGPTPDTTGTEDTTINTCDPTPNGRTPSYCPCEENSECEEGYCVPSGIGKVCTETCINECPSGWSCELVSGTGSDTIFLCLPNPLIVGGHLLGDGFSQMSDNGQFFVHHTLGAPRIIGTSSNNNFQLTSGLPQGGL